MTDPIEHDGHDYDRQNFVEFVNSNHGRDLNGKIVDLDNLKQSTKTVKKLCRKAIRKQEQIS